MDGFAGVERLLFLTYSALVIAASLFIETFISFKRGYQETPYKKAEILFNSFFKDETNELSIFSSINFYKDIRCAILHQGETRKWKLNFIELLY